MAWNERRVFSGFAVVMTPPLLCSDPVTHSVVMNCLTASANALPRAA